MSKYRSFDEWWDKEGYSPVGGYAKELAEMAYEVAVDEVLEEVFDEVQYQYSTNIAYEITMGIKKSMENSNE